MPEPVEESRSIDPTRLTTQALQREIASLEKLLDQRINGIEQAVKIAHENLVRVPTDVDRSIAHLGELINEKLATVAEKFISVQLQFEERDVRVKNTATDSKIALDAALASQVKSSEQSSAAFAMAVARSEATTTKQIDQLQQMIASNDHTNSGKFDDLKERINRFEGEGRGKVAAVTERHSSSTSLVNWGGLIVGIVLALIALISLLERVIPHT